MLLVLLILFRIAEDVGSSRKAGHNARSFRQEAPTALTAPATHATPATPEAVDLDLDLA